MSLDIRKLQNLYENDAVSRTIIDTLEEEGASQFPEVTEFGGGFLNGTAFAHLDERKRALEIVKALKPIEKTGCGTFIAGREGASSSMRWELEPAEIYAFATGGGEPLVELEVATLPDRVPTCLSNLDICIKLFSSPKPWPAPVIAAARAGLWEDDVTPPEWDERLDRLERALEHVRRGGRRGARRR